VKSANQDNQTNLIRKAGRQEFFEFSWFPAFLIQNIAKKAQGLHKPPMDADKRGF